MVVVSAMSGETDRLIKLAKAIDPRPASRELDQMIATGEQVTIAMLAIALEKMGVRARSYTGGQVAIRTDKAYNKARIKHIETERLLADCNAGIVPVVAGFQGIRRRRQHHHARPRRLGYHWCRAGGRTESRRVPDLYRCRWRLHD